MVIAKGIRQLIDDGNKQKFNPGEGNLTPDYADYTE